MIEPRSEASLIFWELRISRESVTCPNGQMEESQEKRFAVFNRIRHP